MSSETARAKWEEGGDDVKSAWPSDRLGLHTRYNGQYKGSPTREGELIPSKLVPVRIDLCNRDHEAGIASNRGTARHGEYVLKSCTHRPSNQ